jgi:soluble lytic murein transglycosylase-like protein
VKNILFIILSAICGFSIWRNERLYESLVEEKENIKQLSFQLEYYKNYINYMETSIPKQYSKSMKVGIVKEIIRSNVKETRENFFTEQQLNEYAVAVINNSERFSVPIYLILSITRNESNFNPEAISDTNATGLMQLTKRNGRHVSEKS